MKFMDLKADYAIVIDGDKEVKKNIEDVKIGDIVLVRQFRKAVEQELLELPAGTLEVGETPKQDRP